MRPMVRTFVVLGTAMLPAAALGAQTQTVRMTEMRVQRDSLVELVLGGDVETVKRTLAAWREREVQLKRELRALPESDVNGQRRLTEQLGMHTREGFTLMSAIQSRCMRERGPRPAGYLGLNLKLRGLITAGGQVQSQGNFVTSVEPGSPAERAGIVRDDKVIAIAGMDALQQTPDIQSQLIPGRTMSVRVERDGTTRDFTLTIAPRPDGFAESCGEFERQLAPMRMAGPGELITQEPGIGMRRIWVSPLEQPAQPEQVPQEVHIQIFTPNAPNSAFFAGAMFRVLDADWGEVLGVRQGVIVSDVATGSPAALSGLKGGDVITQIGRSPVMMPMTLVRILNSIEEREAVLTVVRQKEKKIVTLKWSGR